MEIARVYATVLVNGKKETVSMCREKPLLSNICNSRYVYTCLFPLCLHLWLSLDTFLTLCSQKKHWKSHKLKCEHAKNVAQKTPQAQASAAALAAMASQGLSGVGEIRGGPELEGEWGVLDEGYRYSND